MITHFKSKRCFTALSLLQNKKGEPSSEESEGEGEKPKKKKHQKIAAEEWTDPWARGASEKNKVKKKKKKEKVCITHTCKM